MITNRDKVIEKAKNGGYGFAIDRIMRDYRVQHAYKHNYIDCLRCALIDYMEEQVKVARDCRYTDDIVNATLDNLEKQVEAFRTFEEEWDLALRKDDLETEIALKALRKEGEV